MTAKKECRTYFMMHHETRQATYASKRKFMFDVSVKGAMYTNCYDAVIMWSNEQRDLELKLVRQADLCELTLQNILFPPTEKPTIELISEKEIKELHDIDTEWLEDGFPSDFKRFQELDKRFWDSIRGKCSKEDFQKHCAAREKGHF